MVIFTGGLSLIFSLNERQTISQKTELNMKFTIEIPKNEIKGIKEYLKEVCEIKKPNKKDILNFIVNPALNSIYYESINDYIQKYK